MCVRAYIFNYHLRFHSFRVCLGSRKGKELVVPEVIFTLCCPRQKKRQHDSQNGAPETHEKKKKKKEFGQVR